MSARTADELWRWLLACSTCGEPHEFRPVDGGRRWTWAAPDGHPYVARDYLGARLARLREQWDEEVLVGAAHDCRVPPADEHADGDRAACEDGCGKAWVRVTGPRGRATWRETSR